jgi:hypothetical protein
MIQAKQRIIKGNDANIKGKYTIESPESTHSINSVVKSPKVKIIENDAGYVVIQVNCSCGKDIYIKGEYPQT